MALLKCKECGKEVSSNAEKCVHCGFKLKEKKECSEVEKNIKFFLRLAKLIKYIFILMAVFLIIVSVVVFDRNDEIIIISIIMGCFLIMLGFLITPFFKWKAYVLQTLNDIKGSKER